MITRRYFIRTLALLSGGALMKSAGAEKLNHKPEIWFMPAEAKPHKRTWMAFGASRKIWGNKLFQEAQRNVALIAQTIARYEPVTMLVRKEDYPLAQKLTKDSVQLIPCPLDDLWLRDTGPVFVLSRQGRKAAVDFNFNGWGKKQEFSRDARLAQFVAEQAEVEVVKTSLVMEGGGIEVDGQGTAIITESCVLNANRNPGISKAAYETVLKPLLGLKKIIWLPGIKEKDITDGHTDSYARFARPGVVIAGFEPNPQYYDHAVTREHLKILKTATDAQDCKLEVVTIENPQSVREKYETDDFVAGYINFYLCNGAVIMPEFGDKKADQAAKEKIQTLFPTREVVQLNIDAIAAGGGGIHCLTQQEPANLHTLNPG